MGDDADMKSRDNQKMGQSEYFKGHADCLAHGGSVPEDHRQYDGTTLSKAVIDAPVDQSHQSKSQTWALINRFIALY